jgi:hypothetical protein
MPEHEPKTGHTGLLMRGSDGSLWFMSSDAKAPVKLKAEVTESINRSLKREPRREISGLSPEVQKILKDQAGIPEPDGIIIVWGPWPPS